MSENNTNVVEENVEDTETVTSDVEANGGLDINDLEAALAANDIVAGDETDEVSTDESTSEELTPETTINETTPNTNTGNTSGESTQPARQDFADRATSMGLTDMGNGCFHYADSYSEVVYRNLTTMGGDDTPVPNTIIPHIAIFTKGVEEGSEWKYVGPISNFYKFEGNGDLIDTIKDSLSEVGTPAFQEENYLTSNLASMRHEIVIQNAQNIPQVGDVYPMISIRNSYDGTKAADITFGMNFGDGDNTVRYSSKNKLGYIRQVHIDGADTILKSAVGDYVTVFSQNIGDMISANINMNVTEDDMMSLLTVIEKKAGKKRREDISAIITEEFGEEGSRQTISSWNLFNALAKFTTLEKNINAKLILEDVVERVLVVPEQMINALAAING